MMFGRKPPKQREPLPEAEVVSNRCSDGSRTWYGVIRYYSYDSRGNVVERYCNQTWSSMDDETQDEFERRLALDYKNHMDAVEASKNTKRATKIKDIT